MEKNKKKAIWFMVLLVALLALESAFVWGISWLIGWPLHLSPLPWWVCIIIALLCNWFGGWVGRKRNGGKA